MLGRSGTNGYIANECVNELGPAVDIAKGIAMMSKIPYEEDLDCNRGRLSEKRNGETNFKTNLSISPNPVSSFINIPLKNSQNIKIYDYSGRLIEDRIFSGGNMNISHYNAGLYFLSIDNVTVKFTKL